MRRPVPRRPPPRIRKPRPPVLSITSDQYKRGGALYDTFCLQCHGIAAITGGVLPDLRKTGRPQDAALWKAAVVDADSRRGRCRGSAATRRPPMRS